MNAEPKSQEAEEKEFSLTVDRKFQEIIGQGQIWEQLKAQAYAYFGGANWHLVEGYTKLNSEENKATFIAKVSGKKGVIKSTKDEAQQENKSFWEKTKEKVGLKKN